MEKVRMPQRTPSIIFLPFGTDGSCIALCLHMKRMEHISFEGSKLLGPRERPTFPCYIKGCS